MTLVSIAQQICREIGTTAPSVIFGNSDETAKKLLAVLQTSGRSLSTGKIELDGRYLKNHEWTALRKEFSFTTVASQAEYDISTYIGDDFRKLMPDTVWDRTNNWPVKTFSPEEWQASKGYAVIAAQNRISIMKRGKNLLIDPTPAGAYDIYGEYLSKNWCESSIGTGQSEWMADADVPLLDEELLILDGKWRFLNRLGENYAEEKIEAERAIYGAANADSRTTPTNICKEKSMFVDNIPNRIY